MVEPKGSAAFASPNAPKGATWGVGVGVVVVESKVSREPPNTHSAEGSYYYCYFYCDDLCTHPLGTKLSPK